MLEPDVSYVRAAEILGTVGYERLAPFDISPASVQRIARELKATRTVDGRELAAVNPVDAVDELTRDAIRIAQRQLARLESRERAGTLTAREMREWFAILRELRAQAGKVRAKVDMPDGAAENGAELEPDPADTSWLAEDEALHAPTPVNPLSGVDHAAGAGNPPLERERPSSSQGSNGREPIQPN
jgi:hypothetical protein